MEFPIVLDAGNTVPLHRQLYEGLRTAIVDGRVAPGARLPSSRALAEMLGVSRTTIVSSFAQLQSEGYLDASTGSGTYVSTELPDAPLGSLRRDASPGPSLRLSSYGASLAGAAPLEPSRHAGTIDFRDGRPAFDAFPHAEWRRALIEASRDTEAWLDYSPDPAGYPELRAAIAAYLGRSRGIVCDAEDVTIVNGSQQAIDLLARVLVEPGDVVALEEPGYLGAQRTFAAHGADLRAIPVDRDGICVELLERDGAGASLVYVTPSHQFPLGFVLSAARRHALLAWAARTNALIVEDDYDSAYRYEGRPIPALYGLDRLGRVAYIGTFSKTMFPALRIGYVVVSRTLRDVVRAAKAFSDRQSPVLEQRALAAFISDGGFERHLRRMRVLYRARRAALLRALERHVGAAAEIGGASVGMHLVVRLPVGDSKAFAARARAAGIALTATTAHHLRGGIEGEFIFGFADHDEATIEAAVARLAEILLRTPTL